MNKIIVICTNPILVAPVFSCFLFAPHFFLASSCYIMLFQATQFPSHNYNIYTEISMCGYTGFANQGNILNANSLLLLLKICLL